MNKLLLFLLIINFILLGCTPNNEVVNNNQGGEMTVNEKTTVSSIINNPLFEDYGKFLFHSGYRNIDDSMTISEIDSLFYKYSSLGHGFGLGIGTSAEGWIDDAIAFWKEERSKNQ